MTRSKLMTDVASLLYVGAALLYFLRPDYYQLFFAAAALFMTAMFYAALRTSLVDRERIRRSAWVVPAGTLAIAAQMVYLAAPEGRERALLIGGGVVAVGFVIYALRRRVT